MSGYSVKNFMDLESSSREGIDIDARFSRSALGSEQVGVSHWRYGPNVRTPVGHRHRVQEEVYVILSGSGRMKLGDEIVDLKPLDVIKVSPEVARAIEVGGERPEGGDGELVHDFWNE
jgi:mannose-6-phosphate isomerase-like protein (cupin superfamily)